MRHTQASVIDYAFGLMKVPLLCMYLYHTEAFEIILCNIKSCLTNAVPGSCTEWNVGKWMSTLHSFRQEMIRIEFFWIRKYLWVPMYHIWNDRN